MKMPSKKKKYNARFPAGRIKKIMQSDEEIGKVAQAVPVIISRTLELFVESLLTKTVKITNSRNAKTLSPSHMKQCIMAENRFDFLRELVKNVPDICVAEDASNDSSPEATIDPSDTPYDLSMPSTSNSNETITQKAMPSNGSTTSLLLRNNGVTRSCGTTIVALPPQQQLAKLNAGPSEESRKAFKRQWEVMNRSQKPMQTPSLRSIPSRSVSIVECVPPKLSRSESAPAGSKIAELQTSLKALSTTTQQQHHKLQLQQLNDILPTDLRRLKHQPKSSPNDVCIATELITTSNNNNNNTIKLPLTPTAIPASIVSRDFANTPVVKIDYSNLALHDTSYSESPTSSSSSSSPSVDKSATTSCIANTQIQTTPPSTSTSTSTQAALATAESPVINIDLSNIVTSGALLASTNFAPVAMATVPPPSPATTSTSKPSSYLELDEDYDNI